MAYTQTDLDKHLQQDHNLSPFSTYLKEIVYGGNDGIVTTFAVVAGFTGAANGNAVEISILAVLLFGLANLFADGTSMGLGNFLSIRSEQSIYHNERAKELRAIRENPTHEVEQTVFLLQSRGFSEQQARQLAEMYRHNESFWADFMMTYEVGMPDPEAGHPGLNALATFFAFVTFGFIPIIPYLIIREVQPAFFASGLFTLLALILLGLLRGQVTKENRFRAAGEIVLIGGISAAVAYAVGMMF